VIIYGINPVREALRAGRASELRVGRRAGGRVRELLAMAAEAGVRVVEVPDEMLERESRGGVHQGILADIEEAAAWSVQELARNARGTPLILVLDSVEDPQNVGAIVRTADAAGVDGVVMQTRHAAARGGAAVKASAGALAHMRVAEVVNIARALDELKEAGLWTVGLAGEGPASYESIDFTLPTALVVGAEGTGLRRLVKERCDWLASIPMRGHVGSLNVSVAAGVVLFEAVRQRRIVEEAGNSGTGGRVDA
jgi:23S rRNA (guanosine2251-2'-O)-methyltransferase